MARIISAKQFGRVALSIITLNIALGWPALAGAADATGTITSSLNVQATAGKSFLPPDGYTITASGPAQTTFTSYSAAPLPAGLNFVNPNKISGSATVPGSYLVSVSASGTAPGPVSVSASAVLNINVARASGNHSPVISDASAALQTGGDSDTFDFSAHASDSDNDPLVYEWDFGDGSPHYFGTTGNTTHTYDKAGSITATLTVRDGTTTKKKNVSVRIRVLKIDKALIVFNFKKPVGFDSLRFIGSLPVSKSSTWVGKTISFDVPQKDPDGGASGVEVELASFTLDAKGRSSKTDRFRRFRLVGLPRDHSTKFESSTIDYQMILRKQTLFAAFQTAATPDLVSTSAVTGSANVSIPIRAHYNFGPNQGPGGVTQAADADLEGAYKVHPSRNGRVIKK